MKTKSKLLCLLTSITLFSSVIGFSASPKAEGVKATEPKTEDTEVFAVDIDNGGSGWIYLGFCLSNYDYKLTSGKEINDSSFLDNSGANVKTKILDQNGNLLSYNADRANRYRTGRVYDNGTAYSFCVYLNGTLADPGFTKVVIPEGTTFPSYNLAYNLSAETRTDLYKTTSEVSFTYDSVTGKFVRDAKESEKTEVELTSLKLIEQANTTEYFYMSFGLSDYDWVLPDGAEESGTLQNALWYLDLITNLKSKVYIGENLASYNATRGNRFRCAYDSYQIVVNGKFAEHGISKVTVKQGAMFPSKATGMGEAIKDLDGTNAGWVATEIKFYVLKADTTFVIDDDPNVDPNTFVLENEYATALATLKTDSIADLEAYKGGASNFTVNKAEYDAVIDAAKLGINNASNKVDVLTFLGNGKTALEAIDDDQTILNNYKTEKKNLLQTQYDALKADRALNETLLSTKFAEGKIAITNATSTDEVDEAYNAALLAMQNVPNNASVRESEKANLDAYKGGANNYKLNAVSYNKVIQDARAAIDAATNEMDLVFAISTCKHDIDLIDNDEKVISNYNKKIDDKLASLDMSKYTAENQQKIKDLCAKAKTDIAAATSIASIESIFLQFSNDIDAIPFKTGGCGGSIIAASAIVSIIALAGVGFVSLKRKEN